MPVNLTPRFVAALKVRTRVSIVDSVQPGLVLRASPSGIKAWAVFFRVAGRQRLMTLGRFPTVTLAEARKKARKVSSGASLGQDAQGEKLAQRRALDFETIARKFLEARRPVLATSTATEYSRMVGSYIKGSSVARILGPELRRPDLRAFLEAEATKAPIMANRLFQFVRAACRWAVREDILETNPAEGLQRPRREATRERVLTEREIRLLWRALPSPGPVAAVVKLLLLLGQRSTETVLMRTEDLDLKAKTWTIPGEFRKNGRLHLVPLPAPAVRILEALDLSGERVFPGVSEDNAERDWWGEIRDAAIAAGAKHFTKHDLRRTCATGCGDLGASPFIVSRILGHATQPGVAVTAIYDRADRLPEMRAALTAWAARVERIASGRKRGADVLAMARG